MDALSEVLRLVRLTGATFFHAELSAPWAIRSPTSQQLAARLMPEAEHLIEFHLVVEGRCWIGVDGEAPIELGPGDLVMVPRGDAHRMGSDLDAAAQATTTDIALGDEVALRHGGGGAVTRLVCGYLAVDRRLCAALIDALPRVFRVDAAGSEVGHWLRSCMRLRLADGDAGRPGAACVLAKLSELLFVEGIRRYVEALPSEQTGWLAGLKDPAVGRALGLLHGRPAEPWTVDRLAREVGVSRSVLAERFSALIGKAPMQYLTQWRLTLAAHLLRSTAKSAAVVAYDVGYESEAAFSRAFRRAHGAPPAAWRRSALPQPQPRPVTLPP